MQLPGPPIRPGADPAGSGRSGEIWAATPPVLEDAQYILDLVVLVNHARSRAATPRPPGRRSRIRRWPPVSRRPRALETVGQIFKPILILDLQVHERLDGIAPASRPAAAVLRPAVVNAWLLFLAALAEASLSLGVAESHASNYVKIRPLRPVRSPGSMRRRACRSRCSPSSSTAGRPVIRLRRRTSATAQASRSGPYVACRVQATRTRSR